MKKLTITLILLVSAYALTACNVQFSTASVGNAQLCKTVSDKYEAINPTTSFATTDKEIHCLVQINNAPSDTKLRARWIAVNAPGMEANEKLIETDLSAAGGHNADFRLTAKNGLPPGTYKVEIYLNPQEGKAEPPAKTLDFSVKS